MGGNIGEALVISVSIVLSLLAVGIMAWIYLDMRKPSFMEKMILYQAEEIHHQHMEDTEDVPGTYAYDLKRKRNDEG